MKYRIIKEFDDNGLRHFELEIWHKSIFGKCWKPVMEYKYVSYVKQFKSIAEVKNYLRSLNVRREIVEVNEVDETNV